MAAFYDRVQFGTATTGTGTLTVGSAVPTYRTPAQAGVANGAIVSYLISDGSNWEVGSGTYASAGATLARTTVYESSNAGSAINLSGNALVALTVTAADLAAFAGSVSSVAGRTGAVTLSQSDITGLKTTDSPTFAAVSVASIALGTRTFLTEFGGDTWITFNAYYDGTHWQRVNPAQTAFAINVQSNNNIPFEANTKGMMLWRAVAAANPIGSTFGATGGWELIDARTEYKDVVIGGYGAEIDGNGTTPYFRVVNYSVGNNPPIRAGILKNLFTNMGGGVDDATKPSWFAGFRDDTFVVERAPAGGTTASSLVTLLTIDSSGNIAIAGSGLGGGSGSGTTVLSSSKTANYTLTLADAGTVVEMSVSSANTVTVPPHSSVSFPVGAVLEVCQSGLGQTSLAAAVGVTFRNPGATLACRAQWSTLSLRQRATDEWVLGGDLA